jgi:regulator of replication initiation timing
MEQRWRNIRSLMAKLDYTAERTRHEWNPQMKQGVFSWILNNTRIMRETANLERWLEAKVRDNQALVLEVARLRRQEVLDSIASRRAARKNRAENIANNQLEGRA